MARVLLPLMNKFHSNYIGYGVVHIFPLMPRKKKIIRGTYTAPSTLNKPR